MFIGKLTYSAQFPAPPNGTWVAFFIAFRFYNPDPGNNFNFELSETPKSFRQQMINLYGETPDNHDGYITFNTEASIWPNTFPFADCDGADCGNREV